jgi:hypothetical protein
LQDEATLQVQIKYCMTLVELRVVWLLTRNQLKPSEGACMIMK